jgi:hypothetical protein
MLNRAQHCGGPHASQRALVNFGGAIKNVWYLWISHLLDIRDAVSYPLTAPAVSPLTM